MRLSEISLRQKAGVIPYYIDDNGTLMMMFMIPSNSQFGGTQFQIAKGRIEADEDVQQAALREAEEELGLRKENIKQVKSLGTKTITGLDETYLLTVLVAEIKDPSAFNKPHYETGARSWLTFEEFTLKGRKNQLPIVIQAKNTIESNT